MKKCMGCGKELLRKSNKYCSNKCQSDVIYQNYIREWKKGCKDGSRGINTKNISGHIVRYLMLKYSSKCFRCGWCEVNPITNKVSLDIDHIDGDSENNEESNLVLLCPNCHSLTPTYKNLNKGKGRLWRREKYGKII